MKKEYPFLDFCLFNSNTHVNPDPEEVKAIVREQASRDALITQELLTRIEHVHTRVLKRINQLRVFVYASAIIIMVMFLADIILDHGGF